MRRVTRISRLHRRLRSERGASAVMAGILMIPLIGGLAIALDVGALYAERAQLQNGADAAALAVAQACAEGSCGDAASIATLYADDNANDGAANVLEVGFPSPNSVTVTTSTRTSDGGDALRHPFASLLGIDSTTVAATATAEWGGLASGSVFPMALSLCEFTASGAADGQRVTIRTDTNMKCKHDGIEVPGGFGWLDQSTPCEVAIDLSGPEVWLGSQPGNSVPGPCKGVLPGLIGTTVVFPVYDGSRGNGQNAAYRISGFAAFHLTGYRFSGLSSTDPAAPACSGNCRGIQGYFDRWVSLEGTPGGRPPLNAYAVALTG